LNDQAVSNLNPLLDSEVVRSKEDDSKEVEVIKSQISIEDDDTVPKIDLSDFD
jgi:hypothetical protein